MSFLIRPAQPADIAAIARIHVDGWRAAYADFLPAEFLGQLSVQEDAASFAEWVFGSQPAPVCLVALCGDQVVGFALGGANSDEETRGYDAEIYKLFVQPEYQGQRLGQQLLHQTARELHRRGYRSLVLWAYRLGRSVGFYRHLGGEIVYQTCQQAGGQAVDVVVFAWTLPDLITRSQLDQSAN